jgi:membrane protein DedA with SNARE-associated domain
MQWRRFALFNFLGALVWVVVIASLGYSFGSQWGRLLELMKEANWIILAVVAVIIVIFLWKRRRARRA